MNCPNCQKEIQNDAYMCPYCGTNLHGDNTEVEFHSEDNVKRSEQKKASAEEIKKQNKKGIIAALIAIIVIGVIYYFINNSGPTGNTTFTLELEDGNITEMELTYENDVVSEVSIVNYYAIPDEATEDDIEEAIENLEQQNYQFKGLSFIDLEYDYDDDYIEETVTYHKLDDEHYFDVLVSNGFIELDTEDSDFVSYTKTKENLLKEGYEITDGDE